jgi:hypothetical protein
MPATQSKMGNDLLGERLREVSRTQMCIAFQRNSNDVGISFVELTSKPVQQRFNSVVIQCRIKVT